MNKVVTALAALMLVFAAGSFRVSAEEVNVALGKPCMASTHNAFHETNYVPSYANDGSTSTQFATAGNSIHGENQYWMVDLLANYKITKIKIIWRGIASEPRNTMLQVANSLDFSDAVTVEHFDNSFALPENSVVEIPLDSTDSYRYVRIIKTTLTGLGMREVEVYSADTPAVLAKPPVLYGARIVSPIRPDGTAALSYVYHSPDGVEPGEFSCRWTTFTNRVPSEPYNATLLWQMLQGSSKSTAIDNIPTELDNLFLKTFIYPVDANGTIGRMVITPPHYVTPADKELADISHLSTTDSIALTDGDLNTQWSGERCLIDLGAVRNVARVELYPALDASIAETSNIQIILSENENLSNPLTFTQGASSFNGAGTAEENQHPFARDVYDGSYRYIQLRSTTGQLSVAELKIYESVRLNDPPVIITLSITDDARVGSTITGSYSFSDPDGDGEGTHDYQWLISPEEDGEYVPLVGETRKSITLDKGSVGSYIKLRMTPADDLGKKGGEYYSQTAFVHDGLKISGWGFTVLPSSGAANAGATITNVTGQTRNLLLIVAVYDKTTGLAVDFSFKSFTVAPMSTVSVDLDQALSVNGQNRRVKAMLRENGGDINALAGVISSD